MGNRIRDGPAEPQGAPMPNDVPFEEYLTLIDTPPQPPVETGMPRQRSARPRPGGPVEQAAHRYGPSLAIRIGGPIGPERGSSVDPEGVDRSRLTRTEQLGLDALVLRQSPQWQAAKASRPRQGEPWDMAGRCRDESAPEARALGSSDYLEGSVAVGIVIVNGPTPELQFSVSETVKVVAEVQAGLSYLAGVNPAANVTYLYDTQFPRIDVPADPNLPEDDREPHWRDPALAVMGFSSTGQYVDDIKARLGTTWAYAAYFVKYPVRHFAYANSIRVVMQYANDGWGPDNIDRVFAHETGHVFGCPDEYADSGCSCGGSHGRFGEPNDNCENCGPGVACVMKKNDYVMCKHTYRHLGWMSPVRPGTTGWVSSASAWPDRLDCFAVDEHGAIRWAFWEPGMSEWFQGWIDLLGGRAAPGAHVGAASRRPGQLDIFVVGTDGQVWTAALTQGGTWAGWWPIPGVTVPQRGYVHAVSRSLDRLDIFVTDTQGRIMSAAWHPSHAAEGWHGWWHLNGGMAAPGAPVTAVSRSADQLDIFVTGTDQRVYTAAWHPSHAAEGWRGWWQIPGVKVRLGGYVSAVSRSADHLDIFACDTKGRVRTAAWAPTHEQQAWQGWQHILGGLGGDGGVVHAISRSPDQLDIFVIGTDQRIYTAAWHPSHAAEGWRGWWDINGGMAVVGAAITGVSRGGNALDIFMNGLEGAPWTAGWSPANADGAWGGWWAMGP